MINKLRSNLFMLRLKIKNYFYSLVYRSFVFKRMVAVFKRVANEGYGSDLCLKEGYLPLPVHFYSPIPDIKDLEKRKIWDKKSHLAGIEFNQKGQLELLRILGKKYGQECNWPLHQTSNPAEFYTDNNGYGYGCAAALYSIIREYQPGKIIEIGSGLSSTVINQAINVNQKKHSKKTDYTIIDPYPAGFIDKKYMKIKKFYHKRVELTDPEFFDQLSKNDILFIDSSHTSKIGSDVNFLYLEVLPRLKPGVIVHVHDINLPYEYQKVYATSETFRQFWTEQYLLQAFLCGNKNYEILLGMWYLMTDHSADFRKVFPFYDPRVHKYISSSFWMRKKDAKN